MASCCCSKPVSRAWFYNKLLWAMVVLIFMLSLSLFVPLLAPFRKSWFDYARILFWPLLLGLVAGGIIDYFVPREYVSHILAGKKKRSIVYAVVWGFAMTLCCHGILALAVQLYKKGASPASVVAFLLASPWANLPLTLMLIGFFGWLGAVYIVLSAIVTALLTGWIFQVLESRGLIERNPNTVVVDDNFDILADARRRFMAYRPDLKKDGIGIFKGTVALAEMTLWWVLLGMSAAAAAGAYIPTHFFSRFMGRSLTGLVVTLLLASVVETCSEGSSPLAFEIYRQTGALGNALVFLMAGVASDYTEIGLLWVTAGRRTALWMPAIAIPFILFMGWLGNVLF